MRRQYRVIKCCEIWSGGSTVSSLGVLYPFRLTSYFNDGSNSISYTVLLTVELCSSAIGLLKIGFLLGGNVGTLDETEFAYAHLHS